LVESCIQRDSEKGATVPVLANIKVAAAAAAAAAARLATTTTATVTANAPTTQLRPSAVTTKPADKLVMHAVREVCLWVDFIGMAQYRKKFAHHCIDGRLLLMLTEEHLKGELAIGPLGMGPLPSPLCTICPLSILSTDCV
jgi:hypothetical protein